MDYQKIIKYILIDKDLKQSTIAEVLKVDRQTISRILNGTSVTNVNTLIDILKVLDCELYIKNGKKEYKVDKVNDN